MRNPGVFSWHVASLGRRGEGGEAFFQRILLGRKVQPRKHDNTSEYPSGGQTPRGLVMHIKRVLRKAFDMHLIQRSARERHHEILSQTVFRDLT